LGSGTFGIRVVLIWDGTVQIGIVSIAISLVEKALLLGGDFRIDGSKLLDEFVPLAVDRQDP
jgi:hypothetical protein